ncbi:MAG: SxtJ family membrane protein [Pseudomonadota bacterium]
MHIEIPDKKGLREFGLVTGGLFVALFGLLFPWLFGFDYPYWPWIVAGVLWALALVIPNGLKWIYQGWMSIALVIGWINTRLILAIVFYLIITPMGSIMRLFGKNPVKRKPSQLDSFRKITHYRSPKQMEHPF